LEVYQKRTKKLCRCDFLLSGVMLNINVAIKALYM